MSRLNKITDEQREIVFKLINDGQTTSHVASYMGLTKADVRRLKKAQQQLANNNTADNNTHDTLFDIDHGQNSVDKYINVYADITERDVIDFDEIRRTNIGSAYYRKYNVQWLARSTTLFTNIVNHRRNKQWSQDEIRELTELVQAEFTNTDIAKILNGAITSHQIANLKNACYEYARTHNMKMPADNKIGKSRRVYNMNERVIDNYTQKLIYADTKYELVKNKRHGTPWTLDQVNELVDLIVNEKLTLAEIARFNNELTPQDIANVCNEFEHARNVICKSNAIGNAANVDNADSAVACSDDEHLNDSNTSTEISDNTLQTNNTRLFEPKPLRREWDTPDIAAVTLLKNELSVSAIAQALNRHEDDVECMLNNL